MMKKAIAAFAVALAASVCAATPALALGDTSGPDTANGNGAAQSYGNQTTGGKTSPSTSVVSGVGQQLCAGLPRTDLQSILGVPVPISGNVGVQDIPVGTAQQHEQCANTASQATGDGVLGKLGNAIASGNGSVNG